MIVETFIELVEILTDEVYNDIEEHPSVHRKQSAEAVGLAFRQAVKIYKSLEKAKNEKT